MQVQKINGDTLVAADLDKYLIIKSLGEQQSVKLLGKIQAIRFTNGFVPELEEIAKKGDNNE